MTAAEREALVAHWLESELDEFEDAMVLAGPLSQNHVDCAEVFLKDDVQEAREHLMTNDWRRVEKEADALLKAAGFPPLDHDGADFGRLCRRLLQAKLECWQIKADRWQGKYTHHNGPVILPPPPLVKPTASPASPLFSVVANKYLAENPMIERTRKPLQAEFTKFVESIGGDRPIAMITKGDGRTYKDHLLHDRKLGLLTVAKNLGMLATLFKWAEAQGYLPDGTLNPMKGLAPSKKAVRKDTEPRKPFNDSELLTIFGSKEFLKQRDTRPERYWVILLSLFEVCRRDEGAQLVLTDIQESEGVPFLNLTTDEELGQHVKNEGSKRRVPVHESLIRLGFLDYVKRTKDAGHVRLFPQLTRGHNGWADPVGKWFGRLIRKLGILDTAKVLHSLRHGGITKLHAAGVPLNICQLIAGHTGDGIHTKVYVHKDQLPLKLLQEGLEKLRYDEVVKALTATKTA